MDTPVPSLNPRQHFEAARHFVGWVTPSGNTVVERVTLGILRNFPQVSPHFSRTPVSGSADPFPATYDFDAMLAAGRLLADLQPDLVSWNGSKAGSIDFALDRELLARLQDTTGVPGTTSTLAIDDIFREDGVTRFALVCPYPDHYRSRVVATFARAGYDCTESRSIGLADNLSYAQIPLDDIVGLLRDVAASRPQAIVTYCTNFPAAPVVAEMEDELGIPIYDSTSIVVWRTLSMLGLDTRPGRDWGRAFER